MRDPVTISTGMTFDRESIHKWLFSYKKTTCPITKQPLSDFRLTPNSNLQRLIQSWHLKNNLSSNTIQEKSKAEAELTVSVNSLLEEIGQPHLQAKIQAALLLKSMFRAVDGIYKAGLNVDFFESLTEIMKDQNSRQGSVAVLSILVEVLSFGKNKEKAIKGGIIPVLVELLAEDNKEKRVCEMMLVVLEKLCKKAEGREAFLAHPIGMAAVLSKVLRVSHVGNDKAVSLFLRVFRFCKRREVALEFMEVGGVSKLLMLVQSGCSSHTKYRARDILGLHLKEWNNSPCFPHSFRHSDATWG